MMADDDAWLDDKDAQERAAKLVLDQMALALRNLAPNHWLMPVFTAIICVMFWRWIAPARLIGWFAAVTLSVIPLAVASSMFRRHMPNATHWKNWVIAVSASYFVFTAVWSSLGYFLWVPDDNLNHMLVLLILGCTIAGNSALINASKPLVAVAFATYGAATVLTPLQQGGTIYNGLSLLAVLFVVYLAYMSRQMHDTARSMLLLRNDKNDLIMALAGAKQESDEARTRAEAASLAKSQFLANMSHELRTPLNAIIGFSELIATNSRINDPEKNREYAELIHGSGHHLLELINDILDLAKIEAGHLTLHEAEQDIGRMIDDAHALIAPKAKAGGCVLLKEVPADLPCVMADGRAINQVLLNLLSNAVKFTPPGGTISSFARIEDDGRLAFGVRDTGIGIAKDDQELVFQKFGQGRHDVVTADKGTGLGLPIVKGLVEAHGGTITLESEVGEGTTVTVRLPAKRQLTLPLRAAS